MKKAFTIFLSLLMLVSNTGLIFATHYCGGKAVKSGIILGHDSIGCGMEDTDNSCENQSQSPFIKSNCCQNQYVQLQIEDSYNSPTVIESPVDFNFITILIVSYINLYSFDGLVQTHFLNYAPPLLDLDIPVLIQSFLL